MFTWWQLSDIHWGRDESPAAELVGYMDGLVAHLGNISLQEFGKPDAIIITGDLSSSGQPGQYRGLMDILINPLRNISPLLEEVPILAVPGNHDLNWDVAADLNSSRISNLSSSAAVDAFLANRESCARYLSPFGAYQDFVTGVSPPEACDLLSWNYSIRVDSFNIEITGINSAWSCFHQKQSGVEEERHLLIGLPQVPTLPSAPDTYKFLVTHHPFGWLNTEICSGALSKIRQSYDMILSGHVHSAQDLSLATRSNGAYCEMPSPLLCDWPYEGDSVRHSRGFAIGTLNPQSSQMIARYFRYSPDSRRFISNQDVHPANSDHFSVYLRVNRRGSAEQGYQIVGALDDDNSEDYSRLADDELIRQLRAQFTLLPEAARIDRNAIDAYRDVLSYLAMDKVKAFGKLSPAARAFAIVASERVIARRVLGLRGRSSQPAIDLLSSDMALVREHVPEIIDSELNIMLALVQQLEILDPKTLVKSMDRNPGHVVLAFVFFWTIAQALLLLDDPDLIPGATPAESSSRPNILSAGLRNEYRNESESGRILIKLATDERSEFHRIAEVNHAFERFMEVVEDLWRGAGSFAPPVRFDLLFPNWRHRTLQSHSLRIDPKPVTRLLMGKTLYGDRKHVWLRELLQNALDAIEMRRSNQEDISYEPSVDIEMHDDKTVILRDNGIGMSYEYIIAYLTTLGRSGWRVTRKGEADSANNAFFGRFGIGFASVFSDARSVDIRTRPAGARGVEGQSVRFSSPDRPFFIEPTVCPEGTEITVRLAESISRETFRSLIKDLFIYLPSYVHVSPEVGIANGLDEVSGAGRVDFPPSTAVYEEKIFDLEVDGRAARVKIELLDLGYYERRKSNDRDKQAVVPPASQLTICVDGVHVLSRIRLDLGRERGGYYNSYDNYPKLAGCYVTLDFTRGEAPVMPSRNEIEISEAGRTGFIGILMERVAEMLPEFMSRIIADSRTPNSTREVFLDCAGRLTGESHANSRPDGYAGPVREKVAELYRAMCPVRIVRLESGPRIENSAVRYLDDVHRSGCRVVVTHSLAESGLFAAFARSKGYAEWVEARDEREVRIIRQAWRYQEPLDIFVHEKEIFAYISDFMDEVRDCRIVALLRGDYAVMKSHLFGESLYLQIPQIRGAVTKEMGAQRRREEIDRGVSPRVAFNWNHPIIVAIEEFLADCSEREVASITHWLDSFCDGVVEDKSVRVPAAKWVTQRASLEQLLGRRLRKYDLRDLRM